MKTKRLKCGSLSRAQVAAKAQIDNELSGSVLHESKLDEMFRKFDFPKECYELPEGYSLNQQRSLSENEIKANEQAQQKEATVQKSSQHAATKQQSVQ